MQIESHVRNGMRFFCAFLSMRGCRIRSDAVLKYVNNAGNVINCDKTSKKCYKNVSNISKKFQKCIDKLTNMMLNRGICCEQTVLEKE